MPRFSEHFNLGISQAQLDFVDVELSGDTPLYLDPYAIQTKSDDWSSKCIDQIRSFFQSLLILCGQGTLREQRICCRICMNRMKLGWGSLAETQMAEHLASRKRVV